MISARDKALHYLGRFSRTERQVADYLKRKEFPPSEISETISYLRESGFLNDTVFAESFIRSKIIHGDGPIKIKQMLFQKGIASTTSEALLREHYPIELQLEAAKNLLISRISKRPGSTPKGSERERFIRFVASRGFPLYVIIQAFKEVAGNKPGQGR